jgi:hypothetical protein
MRSERQTHPPRVESIPDAGSERLYRLSSLLGWFVSSRGKCDRIRLEGQADRVAARRLRLNLTIGGRSYGVSDPVLEGATVRGHS